jgi:DNA-binding transcriptional ArsR family regulator
MAKAAMAVVRDTARAAHLMDPTRAALLERLAEPGSASSLARDLGLPRQRINYHLRELEKAGFLELVEERRKGNCVERLVRATARSYLISPEVLGALGATPAEQQDRFSAGYLMAAAGRLLRDLGETSAKAAAARKRVATLTLEADVRFATVDARTAFAEELSTAVARLIAKYDDEATAGGRTFHLIVGAYPARAGSRTADRASRVPDSASRKRSQP